LFGLVLGWELGWQFGLVGVAGLRALDRLEFFFPVSLQNMSWLYVACVKV
jgi:hypothetical protein